MGADEVEYGRSERLMELEAEMLQAAESLEFERAAKLRDRIKELKSAGKR
jgi:excinuclease ABC subunit B